MNSVETGPQYRNSFFLIYLVPDNGIFPKWKEIQKFCIFKESDKSLNHGFSSFRYLYAGSVVRSWSITQAVVGSNSFFTKIMSLISVKAVKIFRENSIGNHLIMDKVNLTVLTLIRTRREQGWGRSSQRSRGTWQPGHGSSCLYDCWCPCWSPDHLDVCLKLLQSIHLAEKKSVFHETWIMKNEHITCASR